MCSRQGGAGHPPQGSGLYTLHSNPHPQALLSGKDFGWTRASAVLWEPQTRLQGATYESHQGQLAHTRGGVPVSPGWVLLHASTHLG